MLFYGASLNVCSVFMKGRGLSCHAVNPFQKAERITVKQKFFATQGDETHEGRACNSFPAPPKRIVEQTTFPELPDPFYRYWSGWNTHLRKRQMGFFFSKDCSFSIFIDHSSLALGLPQFWNNANKINGCIVKNPKDLCDYFYIIINYYGWSNGDDWNQMIISHYLCSKSYNFLSV